MINIIPNPATFGIIAPAFPSDSQKLEAGIQAIKKLGHAIVLGKSLNKSHLYFSGTDRERVDDIHSMFESSEVDIIICARGGWGSLRLLDKIDYDLIRRNPKILIGYSDITTLQLAIWKKCSIPSLSGPMVAVDFAGPLSDFTSKIFWDQIYNQHAKYRFDRTNAEIWNDGNTEGLLLGGCLSMIVHLLGTPYSPDYDNSILFIEDVGDEPYKIDRNLAQLDQSGILNNINGLIIGQFTQCEDDNDSRNHISARAILEDYFGSRPYPVIYNFPYGHISEKYSLPIGIPARIDTKSMEFSSSNFFT